MSQFRSFAIQWGPFAVLAIPGWLLMPDNTTTPAGISGGLLVIAGVWFGAYATWEKLAELPTVVIVDRTDEREGDVSERIEYGTAVVQRHDDGTLTVVQADDVIGVSDELWDQVELLHRPDDETLVLDTAGLYRYRKVGEQPVYIGSDHTVLIFERIKESGDE